MKSWSGNQYKIWNGYKYIVNINHLNLDLGSNIYGYHWVLRKSHFLAIFVTPILNPFAFETISWRSLGSDKHQDSVYSVQLLSLFPEVYEDTLFD